MIYTVSVSVWVLDSDSVSDSVLDMQMGDVATTNAGQIGWMDGCIDCH